MNHAKFEARFQGPNGASFRAMIRRVVTRYSAELRGLNPGAERPNLPARILDIGDHNSLTVAERATLKLVAADYARAVADRRLWSAPDRPRRSTTTRRTPT